MWRRASAAVSRADDADAPAQDLGPGMGRDRRPDRVRVGQRRLDEQAAAVDEPRQRVAEPEGRDVVERHHVDPVQLGVGADRPVGDGQVVGRRQAFLLGAVARVGLDALVEQLAGERRDELVRRHAAEAADRVAAQAPGALRAQVDVGPLEGERVADPEDPVAARVGRCGGQLVEDRDEVAGRDVARPEPGREGQDARDRQPGLGPFVQGGFDLAGQRVPRGQRFVGPLDDADRARRAEGRPQLVGRERPERGDGDAADAPAGGAEVIDDGERRVGHRAHRDEDLGRVLGAVGVDRAGPGDR